MIENNMDDSKGKETDIPIETKNWRLRKPGEDDAPESAPVTPVPAAGRHAGQPPATKENEEEYKKRFDEGMERRRDELRGKTQKELEDLSAGHNPLAQEILRQRENATLENVVDTLSDEQKRNMVETGEGPLIPRAVAQEIKDQGLSFEQAREGLRIKYSEEQVDKIMSDVKPLLLADGYNPPKDESPAEEEAKLTDDEKAGIRALKNDDRVKALAEEAREALKKPSGMTDDEKASWMQRVKDIFDGTPGKVLGKTLKYTTVGIGIFALILVFLTAMHTGGGKG